MKILIVSQFFYPEVFRINGLAEALAERGHEVTVLTGQPNYPGGQIFEGYSNSSRWGDVYGKVKILRVPVWGRGSGGAISLILNYLSFVLSALVFGLSRLSKPDVCLVWSSSPITSAIPAVVFAKARHVPLAIWVQDLWPESVEAILGRKAKLFKSPLTIVVRWIYQRCDQIWIQSRAFSASVLKHGGVLGKIQYVPNWAEDFYDARNSTSAASDEIKSDSRSLLFAGNLGRAQALPLLLEAAKRLRDEPRVHWYFVGDGSRRTWLAEEIARENLSANCTILAARSPEQMPNLFQQANVLVVSLADDPIFDMTIPSKVQSYLAARKPILASLNGEGARVVTEAGGLVSAANDVAGLVANVKQLLKLNDVNLREMGERSYDIYDRDFRMRSLVERAENLLVALGKVSP